MALTQKQITIKLFFNVSTATSYIQIGEMLFAVRDKIAAAVSEREEMEIRRARDIKEIQLMSLEDDKK